jgi:hypothetical protein
MFAQTTGSNGSETNQNNTGTTAATQTPAGTNNQQTGTNDQMNSGSGQTWTGILVASGCNSSSMQGAWGSGSNKTSSNYQGNTASSMSASNNSYDVNRTTNATAGSTGTSSYPTSSYPAGSNPAGSNPTTEVNRANTGMDRSDNRTGSTMTSNHHSDLARNDNASSTGTQPGDMNRNTVGDHSVNTPQTGMADRNRGADTSSTMSSNTSGSNTSGSNTYGSNNSNNTYGSNNGGWNSADRVGSANQDWERGGQNTSGWDRACFITPTTSSFVFLTQDGRQLHLDSASNSLIQQRLQSTNRVSEKNKIFRVRVNGTMSGDTLHVTDIQI